VLHSFSSGADVWEAGMTIGAYFSFSGMITFKKWTPVVPLTAYPSNRLLLETDSPFLAPVPHRGKRNEPAYVREVAARAAALCGEPLDALARRTTANARACFGPRLETVL
jgi:TatD DNase family protein